MRRQKRRTKWSCEEVLPLHVFPREDYDEAPPHNFDKIESSGTAADHPEERGILIDRVAVGGEIPLTTVDSVDNLDAGGLVIADRMRSGRRTVPMGSTTGDVVLSAELSVNLTGGSGIR